MLQDPLREASPYSNIVINIYVKDSAAFVGLNGTYNSAPVSTNKENREDESCDKERTYFIAPVVGHS